MFSVKCNSVDASVSVQLFHGTTRVEQIQTQAWALLPPIVPIKNEH